MSTIPHVNDLPSVKPLREGLQKARKDLEAIEERCHEVEQAAKDAAEAFEDAKVAYYSGECSEEEMKEARGALVKAERTKDEQIEEMAVQQRTISEIKSRYERAKDEARGEVIEAYEQAEVDILPGLFKTLESALQQLDEARDLADEAIRCGAPSYRVGTGGYLHRSNRDELKSVLKSVRDGVNKHGLNDE